MCMTCRVERSVISGRVECPPNKSYTHRAIFLASLAGGGSSVKNILASADTAATIEACRRLGADMVVEGSSVTVRSPIGTGARVPEIDTENSGTTIRIAAGIAALYPERITLTGDESLQKRPMQPLLDALISMGATCTSTGGRPPITVTGRIRGGSIRIPGELSSQFVSSLMIAAPLTGSGINMAIEGNMVSKPYLDATIATMRRFGVSVQTLIPYKRYNIAPQVYRPAEFTVPVDFSSLALLLAAAVLNGDGVTVGASIGDLPQSDEVFIDILEQMGVEVAIGDGEIGVKAPDRLGGGRFDLNNSPDLLPPLSILALKSSGPIEIVNVRHARLKETDRIAIIAREIAKLGVGVVERDDGLVLEPPGEARGAELDAENDHRLFMAFCIAGMHVGGCTVSDPESVRVSYPDFIEEMRRIGAKILD